MNEWGVLISVFIGWFLAELSWISRSSREEKSRLNRALSTLLYVYFDYSRYTTILGVVNNLSSEKTIEIDKEYGHSDEGVSRAHAVLRGVEASRKMMGVDFESTQHRTLAALQEALSDVSAVDALLTIRIRQILDDQEFNKSFDIAELLSYPPSYINAYSTMLGVFRGNAEELRKLVLKISFRIGIINWIRIKLEIDKQSKLTGQREQMIRDTFNEFVHKAQQKGPEPAPNTNDQAGT